MHSYQTFPGDPGTSNSIAKLASLPMPGLCGKTFLDIGCNEGFFCGYAHFEGARSITGVDNQAEYIALARQRFPACNFIQADWVDFLYENDKKYDVILCASAIHYAQDQEKLLEAMMRALAPAGLLVLEIGIADSSMPDAGPGPLAGWLKCRRGIDERLFPTLQGIEKMLAPYAWKYVGESIPQAGDPVPRFIFHIRKRLPYAILVMGEPGTGKSTAARHVFDNFQVIGGDAIWGQAEGMADRYPKLAELAKTRKGWHMLNILAARMFSDESWEEYANYVATLGGNKDFVFEGYIPEEFRKKFAGAMAAYGYCPVNVELPKSAEPPAEMLRNTRVEARKYGMFLAAVAKKFQRRR